MFLVYNIDRIGCYQMYVHKHLSYNTIVLFHLLSHMLNIQRWDNLTYRIRSHEYLHLVYADQE